MMIGVHIGLDVAPECSELLHEGARIADSRNDPNRASRDVRQRPLRGVVAYSGRSSEGRWLESYR